MWAGGSGSTCVLGYLTQVLPSQREPQARESTQVLYLFIFFLKIGDWSGKTPKVAWTSRVRPPESSRHLFPSLFQVEELSKKLADHDQASRVQQQKLKVGQMGVGRCSRPSGCVGCGGK